MICRDLFSYTRACNAAKRERERLLKDMKALGFGGTHCNRFNWLGSNVSYSVKRGINGLLIKLQALARPPMLTGDREKT
ncbi:hypothetical protein HYALB_00008224 [Hymenoscyphus albidus]|uniref:Uncharacterized protein n=1 Tax=Hymenoscyphus albidus TaxID=595503 RepID=A0A9N9LL74_9HELO|nr:hypothetical protein HYALB_00008224 [Hymenoscyphus albidus]